MMKLYLMNYLFLRTVYVLITVREQKETKSVTDAYIVLFIT